MDDLLFSIRISSSQSEDIYTDNSPSDFIAQLPYTVNVPGVWTCCVDSVFLSAKSTQTPPVCIHIELDCIRYSITYNREERIGATFQVGKLNEDKTLCLSSQSSHEILLNVQKINRIRVRVLTEKLELCNFLEKDTFLTLTFRRKKKKNE